MKKTMIFFMLILIPCLLLSGCAKYPEKDKLGKEWNRDWEMLGTVMGVEDPGNGLKLLENNSVLTGDDTFYASWVSGEPTDYVNEKGKTIDLYPIQVYVLLYGCKDKTAAGDALQDFKDLTEKNYQVSETKTLTAGGQDFEIISYQIDKEDNPYKTGISAFSTLGTYAISIEVTRTDVSDPSPETILNEFLNACHFTGEE